MPDYTVPHKGIKAVGFAITLSASELARSIEVGTTMILEANWPARRLVKIATWYFKVVLLCALLMGGIAAVPLAMGLFFSEIGFGRYDPAGFAVAVKIVAATSLLLPLILIGVLYGLSVLNSLVERLLRKLRKRPG